MRKKQQAGPLRGGSLRDGNGAPGETAVSLGKRTSGAHEDEEDVE